LSWAKINPGAFILLLTILSCGVGIYLGRFFNVLALLPLSLLAAGTSILSSWMSGHGLLASAASTVLPIIVFQAGYMIGLMTREIHRQLLARLIFSQSKQV
jgi:uncharacterized membrane protein